MPTEPDPEARRRDDAYTVDTRRGLRRPRGTSPRPAAVPRQRSPRPDAGDDVASSAPARSSRPQPAERSPRPERSQRPAASPRRPGRPAPDDGYTVDTRPRATTAAGTRTDVRPTRTMPAVGAAAVDDGRPARPARDARAGRPASGGPGGPGGERPDQSGGGDGRPRRRLRRGRVVLVSVALLLAAWLVFLVAVPVAAWNSVARVDNIPDGSRPADTSGYNYLLVGSDSRQGLTSEQKKELTTGSAEGQRTDTIMLVHVSESGGKPVMVSLPRDSYVPIPGRRSNKINAAYSFGGAKLLTETVENVTGIHIDGYVEIGLGGFASIVDAVGGVDLCVPRDMQDSKAGIDLKRGCQTLGGPDALGYVRSRYEDPLGDIGRAARQRQFLGALMKQAATPSTVLLPWRYKSFADSAAGGLTVGEGTGLMDAIRVLQAMRAVSGDNGLSLSVPIASMSYPTNNGVAVKWDTERAKALFTALKDDEPLDQAPPGTTVKEVGNS